MAIAIASEVNPTQDGKEIHIPRFNINLFDLQFGPREALHAAVQEPVPPPHRPLPLHPQHRLPRPHVARRLPQLQGRNSHTRIRVR